MAALATPSRAWGGQIARENMSVVAELDVGGIPDIATHGMPPRRQPEVPEDKLRIALFSGNYNYIMDGAARSQNMLVAHLLERGHEVLIFAPTEHEPAFQHVGTVTSVPSVPFPGKRAEYRIGLGLTPRTRAQLDAFCPDIIHIATPDYTGITALRYAEKHGIPAVASFHTRFDVYPRYYGLLWLEKYLTRYMRWFYSRCIHVYPPSTAMLNELKLAGIGKDLRLWGRGVDDEQFNPARRDMAWRRDLGFVDSDVVVAFVGRLVLEKGVDLFADVLRLAAAQRPNIRALVVGGGPERARFEARLPEGVFIGHQSGAELGRAYASADIFFNPSVTEAGGNVTLEATASSLCCVAAGGCDAVSHIREGETGLLVPPDGSVADYAERLVRLADDAELRGRMGAAARARTLSEHRWPVILEEVIGHYRAAIRGYRAGIRRAA